MWGGCKEVCEILWTFLSFLLRFEFFVLGASNNSPVVSWEHLFCWSVFCLADLLDDDDDDSLEDNPVENTEEQKD